MKNSFIFLICLLLLAVLGCSGPSAEDVEAKADEVVPRAQELILFAAFSPEAECREMAGEFADDHEIDRMPYEDLDLGEQMSRLEELDKGLGQLEKDLKKAGCNP